MTITRVTLIRHGETAWNVENRWQGHANVALNATGLRQAVRVAEHLRSLPESADITAIYSSDLSRAHQTAQAIAEQLSVPVILDTRLREIDMGDWQGMTGDEAELWDGARLHAVRAGGYNIPRPGGESLQMLADRVGALFHEVMNTRPGEHVIFVSHGGTLRMLLHALDLLNDSHRHIGNTSRTVLLRPHPDAPWQIEAYNALDHLAALADPESFA
jgi:broad specificity phosphatase PhoE